jgi:hypothetical protein
MEWLVAALPHVSADMIPRIALPIISGLDLKLVSPEAASDLAPGLTRALTVVGLDPEFYRSIVSMLRALWSNYPGALEVAKLLPACTTLWQLHDFEESPVLGDLLGAFLVELCATIETGEGVDLAVLADVLAAFPSASMSSDLSFILKSVLEIGTKQWARGRFMVDIALFLSGIVLLSTGELRDLQIEPHAYRRAVLALKIIGRGMREVGDAVVRSLEAQNQHSEGNLQAGVIGSPSKCGS